MLTAISASTLQRRLAKIVVRVRKGESFTVLYPSPPAFRVVPVDGPVVVGTMEEEPLYLADAVGNSNGGLTAADHDRLLYDSRDSKR